MKILFLSAAFLFSVSLCAQPCASTLYIFSPAFDSVYVCSNYITRQQTANENELVYSVSPFKLLDKKNKLICDLSIEKDFEFELMPSEGSIIIVQRLSPLPFICDFDPCLGSPITGPRDIYRYVLTKTDAGYVLDKTVAFADLTISNDSLNVVINQIADIISLYRQSGMIRAEELYWLLLLANYNGDETAKEYLSNLSSHFPELINDHRYEAIVKNIRVYSSLKERK